MWSEEARGGGGGDQLRRVEGGDGRSREARCGRSRYGDAERVEIARRLRGLLAGEAEHSGGVADELRARDVCSVLLVCAGLHLLVNLLGLGLESLSVLEPCDKLLMIINS